MRGLAVQHTLKTSIHFTGVGLHSGVKTAVTLRPAPTGTGILFRRLDLKEPVEIRALWSNTIEAQLCTILSDGQGTTIMTIEHLMSALSGCGIDNVIVDLFGSEVPVMDGSAGPFVFLIECAGRVPQYAPRKAIRILRTVEIVAGESSGTLMPDDEFVVSCEIAFENPIIGHQEIELTVEPSIFKMDVSRARSFGFLHEVDALRASGRALGGSLDNVIVIDGDAVLNDGGLRYVDEFVRHKVLDVIGDLYLAGGPLLGRFHGVRPSHALTGRLLKALFADRTNWAFAKLPQPISADVWEEPIRAAV